MIGHSFDMEVTAEGVVTERDGVHLIAIKKVTPKGS
jgi:hypothetical protein